MGAMKKERTEAQISDDFAPMTADDHAQALQLKIAAWEMLAAGRLLAPAPDQYTVIHREQMHDTIVLLVGRIDALEEKLRHHTNAIQPRPGEPLPPDDPIADPAPADERTARVGSLVEHGMRIDDAIELVDRREI